MDESLTSASVCCVHSITDDGLLYLVQLHELRELTICGGNVSDHGVEVISKLASLTYLNLSQNPYVRSVCAHKFCAHIAVCDLIATAEILRPSRSLTFNI